MPRKPRGQRGGSKSKHQVPAIDRELVNSTRSGGRDSVNFPSEDYLRSYPSMTLSQTPPKNIRGQIHWVQAEAVKVNTLASSGNTEFNIQFALSDLASVVGLTGYFDQYCIYSIVVTLSFNDVGVSATTETGRGYTAIDYDNTTNLGSESAIQAFGTAVAFVPGRSVQQRLIKPCVAPALYNAGAVFTGYGVARAWLDCTSTGIIHYGYRSFFSGNGVSGINANYIITYIIGFRNNN